MWNLVKVATTQRWIVECPLSAPAQSWLSEFRRGFTFLSPIHPHLDFFQPHFYFSSTSFTFPAQLLLFKRKLYFSSTNNISKPKFLFFKPFSAWISPFLYSTLLFPTMFYLFFSNSAPIRSFSLILTFLAKNLNFQTQFNSVPLTFTSKPK